MVCVDGSVIEILTPTVRTLGDQGRPCSLNLLVVFRWKRMAQRELVLPALFPLVKVFYCAQNRWSAAMLPAIIQRRARHERSLVLSLGLALGYFRVFFRTFIENVIFDSELP